MNAHKGLGDSVNLRSVFCFLIKVYVSRDGEELEAWRKTESYIQPTFKKGKEEDQ